MGKTAVILAGGKGTRLRPYTIAMPKPLVPIADIPILEIVIRQLVSHGFDHVIIAVNHMAELIMAFFGDGSKWGIRIDYSMENMPLSTMGPLKLIKDLPENFLVMNGDVLTDLSYSAFFDDHVKQGNIFTVSAYKRQAGIDYGVLEVDGAGKLKGFQEKPSYEFLVSMGVYMANSAILDVIPPGTKYGFDHLMLDLLERKQPATVKPFSGVWYDIGRPDDYEQATQFFEKNREMFMKDGAR